jgi:hypothetical protein
MVTRMSFHERLAMFLFLCLFAATGVAAPVDGYWLGMVTVSDAHPLRLQLDVQSNEINMATGPSDMLGRLGDHVERRLAGKRVSKFE